MYLDTYRFIGTNNDIEYWRGTVSEDEFPGLEAAYAINGIYDALRHYNDAYRSNPDAMRLEVCFGMKDDGQLIWLP
jgi:hypothetical protein